MARDDVFIQPVGRVPGRPAWIVLATAAAVLALVVAGWLSAWLEDRLRPAEDIVRASVLVYSAPPAVDMRVWIEGTGRIRYLHDGAGTWRREYPSASGRRTSYDLSQRDRYAFYDADARVFVELPSVGVTPTPSWGADTCPTPRRLDDDVVVGRDAYVLDCGATRYWIDRATLLILREVGQPRPGVPLAYREEVETFRPDPPYVPSRFAFGPPEGATSMTWREYNDRYFPTLPDRPG